MTSEEADEELRSVAVMLRMLRLAIREQRASLLLNGMKFCIARDYSLEDFRIVARGATGSAAREFLEGRQDDGAMLFIFLQSLGHAPKKIERDGLNLALVEIERLMHPSNALADCEPDFGSEITEIKGVIAKYAVDDLAGAKKNFKQILKLIDGILPMGLPLKFRDELRTLVFEQA